MSDSTKVGNAGEHLVMAELLYRKFHAFRADRANPAFDISVYKLGQHSLLRVKTTTAQNVQWTAKQDGTDFGTVFLEMTERDFVALVDLRNGVRGAIIYIIPTKVLNEELKLCYDHWHKYSRRNGMPRKRTQHRAFCLDGKEKETDIGYGYAEWFTEQGFRDAWGQL